MNTVLKIELTLLIIVVLIAAIFSTKFFISIASADTTTPTTQSHNDYPQNCEAAVSSFVHISDETLLVGETSTVFVHMGSPCGIAGFRLRFQVDNPDVMRITKIHFEVPGLWFSDYYSRGPRVAMADINDFLTPVLPGEYLQLVLSFEIQGLRSGVSSLSILRQYSSYIESTIEGENGEYYGLSFKPAKVSVFEMIQGPISGRGSCMVINQRHC